MSSTTSNLGLFKYDTTADSNVAFSITKALNNNWDKLDSTIPSLLAKKVNISSLIECQVVIDTYVNGTSGYRIWSDGYCEQWGRTSTAIGNDSSVTITFLKSFKDSNYYANWISCNGTSLSGQGTRSADCLTTTSMRLFNGQDVAMVANWKACGYLA